MLSAHWLAVARDVRDQRQARSQTPAKRLPFAREDRRNVGESGRLGHLERRFMRVDPCAQIGIRAAVKEDVRSASSRRAPRGCS